jgi:hypothetical protein
MVVDEPAGARLNMPIPGKKGSADAGRPYDRRVSTGDFDSRALRTASSAESFPWLARLVTLIRITADGVVTQAKSDGEKRALLGGADDRDLLLAAWPGEWSQDVFVVDDLKAARLALGLPRTKATPVVTAPAPAPTGFAAYHRGGLPGGLWQRLAELADLPVEGQRKIAGKGGYRPARAAVALFQRSDLAPDVRHALLEGSSSWLAEDLLATGQCTAREVLELVERFTESAKILDAALCRQNTRDAVRRRLAQLSYVEAARLWLDNHVSSVQRPELAAAILPVALSKPADLPRADAYGSARYERAALVRSLAAELPADQRLELLRDRQHGAAAQQAFLADTDLTDDELTECLPEITRRQSPVAADSIPALVEHVQRFPRLIELAGDSLRQAIAQLVADGWSPAQVGRAGRWDVLTAITRIADGPDLVDALAEAAVSDRTEVAGTDAPTTPWRDPRRYELIELLLGKTTISDRQIRFLLDRLTVSEIDDLCRSARKHGRLNRLCAEALRARRPTTAVLASPEALQQPELPTDEQLAVAPDPRSVLRDMLRARSGNWDRVIHHALSSVYMTDELAWQLPVKALEDHPVYGPRLAAQVTQICGNSPSRWQTFAESWSQPTQLLASTLFRRLRQTN